MVKRGARKTSATRPPDDDNQSSSHSQEVTQQHTSTVRDLEVNGEPAPQSEMNSVSDEQASVSQVLASAVSLGLFEQEDNELRSTGRAAGFTPSSIAPAHYEYETFATSSSAQFNQDELIEGESTARVAEINGLLPLSTSHNEETTEATVIDSAPLMTDDNDNDVPRWKLFDTEEAQVLEEEEESSRTDMLDRKPRASVLNQTENYSEYGQQNYLDHQEAEIIGIQDDQYTHPLEMMESGATAEFVGQDFSVGVAVLHDNLPMEGHRVESSSGISTHVTILPETDPYEEPRSPGVQAAILSGDLASSSSHGLPATHVVVTAEAVGTPINCDNPVAGSPSPSHHVATPVAFAESSRHYDDPFSNRTMSLEQVGFVDISDNALSNRAVSDLPRPVMGIRQMSEPQTAVAKSVGSERPSDEAVPDWLQLEDARVRHAIPPPPQPFGSTAQPVERETSPGQHSLQTIGSSIARGTTNVMETLFGEAKSPSQQRRPTVSEEHLAHCILPRTLLPWSVIFSASSRMWVATLQTNQKALDSNNVGEASRSLRAFSLPTQRHATNLAKNWTPPRMRPFSENKACHICQTKFAILRRACHCKNCGVVVCRECTVQWPSKMLPDTYNRKESGSLNVCKACDWLCNAFRLSLLDGDFDKTAALFETGNVNINSPFGNVKGELFYPVHCAVIGGNLKLLRWLVDEHCSPIKSLRVSGKTSHSAGKYTPIVTSKGRSLLGIAMEKQNMPIVRYLVVEKGISLGSEKDITTDMLMSNLQAVLHLLPPDVDIDTSSYYINSPTASPAEEVEDHSLEDGRSLSQEAHNYGAVKTHKSVVDTSAPDRPDECIICFDNKIDCVAVSATAKENGVGRLLIMFLTRFHRILLCLESLWTSNYVLAVRRECYQVPCLCIRVHVFESVQTMNPL
jgi:hypothetical protein